MCSKVVNTDSKRGIVSLIGRDDMGLNEIYHMDAIELLGSLEDGRDIIGGDVDEYKVAYSKNKLDK